VTVKGTKKFKAIFCPIFECMVCERRAEEEDLYYKNIDKQVKKNQIKTRYKKKKI